jgi:hypothetical protein
MQVRPCCNSLLAEQSLELIPGMDRLAATFGALRHGLKVSFDMRTIETA